MNRRLADARAALTCWALQRRFGAVVRRTDRRPEYAREPERCIDCGQEFRLNEDRIVNAWYADVAPARDRWAHETCPDLFDAIEWLLTRDHDFVIRELSSGGEMTCPRCRRYRARGGVVAMVADLPSVNGTWICGGCVLR